MKQHFPQALLTAACLLGILLCAGAAGCAKQKFSKTEAPLANLQVAMPVAVFAPPAIYDKKGVTLHPYINSTLFSIKAGDSDFRYFFPCLAYINGYMAGSVEYYQPILSTYGYNGEGGNWDVQSELPLPGPTTFCLAFWPESARGAIIKNYWEASGPCIYGDFLGAVRHPILDRGGFPPSVQFHFLGEGLLIDYGSDIGPIPELWLSGSGGILERSQWILPEGYKLMRIKGGKAFLTQSGGGLSGDRPLDKNSEQLIYTVSLNAEIQEPAPVPGLAAFLEACTRDGTAFEWLRFHGSEGLALLSSPEDIDLAAFNLENGRMIGKIPFNPNWKAKNTAGNGSPTPDFNRMQYASGMAVLSGGELLDFKTSRDLGQRFSLPTNTTDTTQPVTSADPIWMKLLPLGTTEEGILAEAVIWEKASKGYNSPVPKGLYLFTSGTIRPLGIDYPSSLFDHVFQWVARKRDRIVGIYKYDTLNTIAFEIRRSELVEDQIAPTSVRGLRHTASLPLRAAGFVDDVLVLIPIEDYPWTFLCYR